MIGPVKRPALVRVVQAPGTVTTIAAPLAGAARTSATRMIEPISAARADTLILISKHIAVG